MFVKSKIVKSIVVLFALGFLTACSDAKALTDAKIKGADVRGIHDNNMKKKNYVEYDF